MKRFYGAFKTIGIVVIGMVLIIAIYVAYVFLSYKRIEDNVLVEVINTSETTEKKAEVDKEYSIITYNIGFGAYTADFSFFMDGGKQSWAKSKNSVIQCITKDCELVDSFSPDIIFLQEVDFDSTRSYHVNEAEMICSYFDDYAYNFAINYNSAFLMYPLTEPHGASRAGLLTLADMKMESAIRRSLPISESFFKILDMDRCYVITRIPVDNGKELVLFNVHLSAYTDTADIVINQISMLVEDMQTELDKGNYVICGGDFNQDMLGESSAIYKTDSKENTWASPFPKEMLPEGLRVASSILSKEEKYTLAPSCRNADAPYVEGESYVIFIDDFIISNNVEMISFETIDNGFLYSDHNPVMMKIRLMNK